MFEIGYNRIMETFGDLGCITCKIYTFDKMDDIIEGMERGLCILKGAPEDCPEAEIEHFIELLKLKVCLGANIIA